MTCIAGLVHENRVWLAADSLGSAGYSSVVRRDTKVFRLHAGSAEMVIAYTSSFRMGQVLQYKVVPPPYDPSAGDPFRYLVVEFIDTVRAAFAAAGFQRVDNAVESGGCFLIGFQGRLFTVESDYQVGEPAAPYFAMGAGDALALGSLYTTAQIGGLDPVGRLELALAAAAEFNSSVGGPVRIICSPDTVVEECQATPALAGGIEALETPDSAQPAVTDMEGLLSALESHPEVLATTGDPVSQSDVQVLPMTDEPMVETFSLTGWASRTSWQPTAWEPDGLPEQQERVGESEMGPQNPKIPIYVCPICEEVGIENCTCEGKV